MSVHNQSGRTLEVRGVRHLTGHRSKAPRGVDSGHTGSEPAADICRSGSANDADNNSDTHPGRPTRHRRTLWSRTLVANSRPFAALIQSPRPRRWAGSPTERRASALAASRYVRYRAELSPEGPAKFRFAAKVRNQGPEHDGVDARFEQS
jgi:hypothetical protein